MGEPQRIGIMGAGAIGCYVGGRLLHAGVDVTLVGRPALAAELARDGLHLTDYAGFRADLGSVEMATGAGALAGCGVVLVTVKGGGTAAAADALAPVLAPGTLVVSFQNGVDNPRVLRERLPGCTVLAGMVPWNVLRQDGGRFHQGTSGTLMVERHPRAAGLVAVLEGAGLPAHEDARVNDVLWGKLLVNLNNAVNALAGVPIQRMLATRGYRRVMAACAREGVRALRRAGIRPRLDMPLPAWLAPLVLELPDLLFRALSAAMPHVDPQARSSMWDDLQRGRETEVEALNGAIVRLADQVGTPAPVNRAIVALVHQAERAKAPPLDPEALLRATGLG